MNVAAVTIHWIQVHSEVFNDAVATTEMEMYVSLCGKTDSFQMTAFDKPLFLRMGF